MRGMCVAWAHRFRALSIHRVIIPSLHAHSFTTSSLKSTSFSQSRSASVITPLQESDTSQSSTSESNTEHVYSGKRPWQCVKCGTRHVSRVYCPCGELNRALQLRKVQHRQTEAGKAIVKRGNAKNKLDSRAAMNTVRELALASQSADINTCDWQDGCTVPKHLLNIVRLRPVAKQSFAILCAAQKLAAIAANTVDGKLMLRAMCPVHQRLFMKQIGRPNAAAPHLSKTYNTKLKQQKRLELKHCTHEHCFHPDIPECTIDTIDMFSLVPVVDAATSEELDLEQRAWPVDITNGDALPENLRKHAFLPELEKRRLMHLTCHRDHTLRLLAINIDEKKNQLREYLNAHVVVDWYRDAILTALDRHDAGAAAVPASKG